MVPSPAPMVAAESPSAGSDPSCAARLRVLADETRLRVLRELLAGPKRVGELNEAIDVPQNLLSHHLGVLRGARLVLAEREGRAVLYRLAPGVRLTRGAKGIDLGCCRLSFSSADGGA